MGLLGLFTRKPHERAGFALYGAAVGAARQPVFFAELGVPDTLDGRFDLVALHTGLLVCRIARDPDPRAKDLAQAVFDAMFADMDVNLREMGVGDLAVGKRVKRMWEAFHGRAQAYEAALRTGDEAGLAGALARNVWRGEPPEGSAPRLAAIAVAADAALDRVPFAELVAGRVDFPPVPA
ncbi:ubiquinol-cytochrome C chaperone [Falsiroseomonas bella]|uniref:Ubiquinol-cytochrome C chaperone n=1 Tax=Falsiroseomonas bella TaxID=2184016 RepID=A0A317FB64_9PROT|nr:ubiquinol-cytochrome C chaperone family protein [Falsiroseomonas bella]PWS36361.1 ubiquinol-cytochrome C chaperone [Falsiroseomonas bella]